MADGLSRGLGLALALLLLSGTGLVGAGGPRPAAAAKAEAQLLADADFYPALLGRVRAAQKSIDLVTYLWKISPAGGNRPAELLRVLGEAKRRGVTIRVVLENSGYDEELNRANREAAGLLERQGITVFFDSPTVTTHSKLAVIDRRFCLIGSHNLTQSALGRNHEMSVDLDSPSLGEQLTDYVNRLLAKP